ncbi:MAG: O-antigen ligase family protein [Sumerlaeia bacterium]
MTDPRPSNPQKSRSRTSKTSNSKEIVKGAKTSAQSTLAPRPKREDLERPDREVLKGRARAQREAEEARPGRLTVPLFLRKFCELSLLATVPGAAFAYHLQLPNPGEGFLKKYFEPLLSSGLPILELKTTVWLALGMLCCVAFLAARGYELLVRRAVFYRNPVREGRRSLVRGLLPIVAVAGFLLWSFLGFAGPGALRWGPDVPPVAAEAIARGEAAPVHHTGGFSFSLTAWFQVAAALAFFLVAEEMLRTRRLVYKLLAQLIAVGGIATLTALALHVDFPLVSSVWTQFPPEETRNDVAAFIGHNVALSSFLVAPLLCGWAFFCIQREKWSRWLKGSMVALFSLMGLVILLAQSRAVIPVLVLAFAALVVLLARRAAYRPRIAFAVGVPLILLVLLVSQLVPRMGPFGNPLYRSNVTLQERLGNLTPTHLKTETRLRVLLASLPAVADAPLTGLGWGSFQYTYPSMQGQFYREHPLSTIAPTPKRTLRAHNEYLQIVYETGLIGLGLALLGLVTILWAGWRTLAATITQRFIAIQLAVFLSILSLLAHALTDFAPLRVAPLAGTLVILLAIWSAGDRLWLMPVPKVADRPDSDDTTNENLTKELKEAAASPKPQAPWLVSARKVAWIVLVYLLAMAWALIVVKGAHWFSGKTYLLRAQSQYAAVSDSAFSPQARAYAMEDGQRAIQRARLLLPLDGDVLLYNAVYEMAEAGGAMQSLMRNNQQGVAPEIVQAQSNAIMNKLLLALEYLDQSLAEVQYNYSWYVRSKLHDFMGALASEPQKRLLLQMALEDLRRAAEMNPGDSRSQVELYHKIRRLEGAEAARDLIVRQVKHFHPSTFRSEILAPAYEALYVGEADAAYDRMREILSAAPEDPELIDPAASMAYEAGDLEQAQGWAMQLLDDPPHDISARFILARLAMREGNWPEARDQLDALRERLDPETHAPLLNNVAILTALIEARPTVSDSERQLEELLAESPQTLVETAAYALSEFKAPDYAEKLLRRRLAIADPAADIQTRILLAEALIERHREDVDRLEAEREMAEGLGLRTDLREAKQLFEEARDATAIAIHQAALSLRIERLRRLLEGWPASTATEAPQPEAPAP